MQNVFSYFPPSTVNPHDLQIPYLQICLLVKKYLQTQINTQALPVVHRHAHARSSEKYELLYAHIPADFEQGDVLSALSFQLSYYKRVSILQSI